MRPDCCNDADGLGDRKRERAADKGDAERALALPGADIGADQRHQRRAETEDQRNQQIFQPRRGAIPGGGGRAGCGSNQRRCQRDDHVGLHRGDRGDGAHAQDLAEQRPTQTRRPQAGDIAPGQDIPGEHRGAGGVEQEERHAAAGDAERREWADAEDQQRRQRHQHHDAHADHQCRNKHIAGAADDARQAVEQPKQHAAGKHDVRIGHGRVEFAARAAERAIDRSAEAEHDAGEQRAERNMDDHSVHRQRIGLVAPAAAERARDRRRDAAAHGAGGDHLHQHDAGKDERHARERIGPELRYEPGFDQSRGCLRHHDQHIGPRHPQQGRNDRPVQQHARKRTDPGGRTDGRLARGEVHRCIEGCDAHMAVLARARRLRLGGEACSSPARGLAAAYLRRVRSPAAGPAMSA